MPSVVAAFHDACTRYPGRVALEGASESLTFSELDALTDRIAGGLASAGVAPGRHVALFLGRSTNFVAAALAVLKCGAVYVPIDPEYPAQRRRAILGDLSDPIGIIDSGGTAVASSVECPIVEIGLLRAHEHRSASVNVEPDAPAYVMFTSGSTGVPKGSIIPHRGIVRLVCNADYAEFGPDHRWALLSSVAFDASTLEIWGPLLNGGTCVVLEDRLPSLDRIADFFRIGRVTDTWLTAALFNSMVDYRVDAFRSMRQVFSGGDIDSPRHFRRFIEACPEVRLIHGYGPTENTTFSLCHTVRREDTDDGERVPIGKAIRGTTLRIVDSIGAEVPSGAVGQLLVGGDGVALGYLNQPGLTRERFVLADGDARWYRTGDLVRQRADGLVEFVGRVDRQVKVRGFRIEPEEIEKTLTSCPGVTAGVVEVTGEDAESRRLVAYAAVPDGASASSIEAINRFLAERLPPHMLPSELHVLTELPLGTTGKVDRRLLNAAASGVQTPPSSENETILARIWQNLLPGVEIGRETDFFSVGGHSVLVLKMIAEIRRQTGAALLPSAAYELRTLRRIAAAIEALPNEQTKPAPADREPQEALHGGLCGSMQRSLYYEWRLDPSGSAYHVHAGFIVEPGLDLGDLRSLFSAVIARHDALRVRFLLTDQGLRQRFFANADSSADFRDEGNIPWGGPPEPLPEAALDRIYAPFDIERDPPVRLHVFSLPDERRLVVLSLHHATVDDWSLDLLIRELSGTSSAQTTSTMVPQSSSILRYVEWERGHTERDIARLRGVELAHSVQNGYPLLVAGRGAAVTAIRRFDATLAERLRQFAACKGVTTFVVLLAAYGLFLRRKFSLRSPWILTPFANRADPSLSGVVGCCIDLRLLHLTPGELDTFTGLVQRTARTVNEEHDLGAMPLEEVSSSFRQHCTGDFGTAMQFVMTYRVDPNKARTLAGRAAEPVRVPAGGSKFGLLLQIEQSGATLDCIAESAADAFTAGALADLLNDFEASLLGALERPDALIFDAPPGPSSAGTEPIPTSLLPIGPVDRNDELDAACRSAWCRVLGRDQAERHDDFFRCGGTSLLALRLTAEVRRQTGVTPAVGLFVAQPTLEGLCRLVRLGGGEAPLVSSFGDPASNSVIFAVPGLGNSAIVYHSLWLEFRRLIASPPLLCSADFHRITDIVRAKGSLKPAIDQLVESCLELSGDRPFALAGFSLGGLIIPEMAMALAARGRLPTHVWLLDPYATRFVWPPPLQEMLDRLLRLVRMPGRLPRWAARKFLPHAAGTNTLEADEQAEAMRSNLLLRDAFRTHPFSAYAGQVTFLRSGFSTAHAGAALADRLHGMQPHIAGPCRMVDLDIAHIEFLRGGVAQVAAVMANELSQTRLASSTLNRGTQ